VEETPGITSITIVVPVGDLDAAVAWYRRVFAVREEIEPVAGITELEIFPGCWLQLQKTDGAGGAWMLRYGVPDVERERRRLLDLGVDVGDVQRIAGVIAFADFVDPFGNGLSVYQVL